MRVQGHLAISCDALVRWLHVLEKIDCQKQGDHSGWSAVPVDINDAWNYRYNLWSINYKLVGRGRGLVREEGKRANDLWSEGNTPMQFSYRCNIHDCKHELINYT